MTSLPLFCYPSVQLNFSGLHLKGKSLVKKPVLLTLAVLFLMPLISDGAETIPPEVSSLKFKREAAMTANKQNCDRQLEQLKAKYSKDGNLDASNLIVILQTCSQKRNWDLLKFEIPHDVMAVESQRAATTAKINKIYHKELDKLKVFYTKSGNLNSANLVARIMIDVPSEVGPFYGTWSFSQDRDGVTFTVEPGGIVRHLGLGTKGSWTNVSEGKIRVTYAPGKWCEIMMNNDNPFVTSASSGKTGPIIKEPMSTKAERAK